MNIPEEKFERLLRFLDGEMNLTEIAAFEKELIDDPNLRAQLDFQLKLMAAFEKKIEPVSDDGLRSILNAAKKKHIDSNEQHRVSIAATKDDLATKGKSYKKPIHIKSNYWLAAASVVLLAFIAVLAYYGGKKTNPAIVFVKEDSLKKEQTNIVQDIHRDSTQSPLIKESTKINYAAIAKEAYEKDTAVQNIPEQLEQPVAEYLAGNNKTIQELVLEKLPKSRGENNDARIKEVGHYYKGLGFYETGDYDKSFYNLQWVSDSASDQSLQVKANWYLALVYLKKGDVERSKVLLKQLSVKKAALQFKEKATMLLKKIEY